MIAEVRDAVGALEAAVRDLEPGCLDGVDAARLVGLFAKVEHLGAAGKAHTAARVEATGVWRASGQPSFAAWLARESGTSLGSAIATVQTMQRLEELPETKEAFRAGELSEAQAREIADAAILDPSAQPVLLRAARRDTFTGLRKAATRVKTTVEGAEARAARIHKDRWFRTWTDTDGAGCGAYRMPVDAAARVKAVVDAETEARFRDARAGVPEAREAREAYAADALVAIADRAASGNGDGAGAKATLLARVEVAALPARPLHLPPASDIRSGPSGPIRTR